MGECEGLASRKRWCLSFLPGAIRREDASPRLGEGCGLALGDSRAGTGRSSTWKDRNDVVCERVKCLEMCVFAQRDVHI